MSSFDPCDLRLRRWLRALVETPGLTAIGDVQEARRALVEDSLRGVELVTRFAGPIVDVGSGGGIPGIPLAASLPDRDVTLLEANGRKCQFLCEWAPPNGNEVVGRGTLREHGRRSRGIGRIRPVPPPTRVGGWVPRGLSRTTYLRATRTRIAPAIGVFSRRSVRLALRNELNSRRNRTASPGFSDQLQQEWLRVCRSRFWSLRVDFR